MFNLGFNFFGSDPPTRWLFASTHTDKCLAMTRLDVRNQCIFLYPCYDGMQFIHSHKFEKLWIIWDMKSKNVLWYVPILKGLWVSGPPPGAIKLILSSWSLPLSNINTLLLFSTTLDPIPISTSIDLEHYFSRGKRHLFLHILRVCAIPASSPSRR